MTRFALVLVVLALLACKQASEDKPETTAKPQAAEPSHCQRAACVLVDRETPAQTVPTFLSSADIEAFGEALSQDDSVGAAQHIAWMLPARTECVELEAHPLDRTAKVRLTSGSHAGVAVWVMLDECWESAPAAPTASAVATKSARKPKAGKR